MPSRKTQGRVKSMRHVREILRLGLDQKMSYRAIGRSLGVSKNTARKYIETALRLGWDWGKVCGTGDEELAKVMGAKPKREMVRPLPDLPRIHTELKRPGVTLSLLWEEYREAHPDGYQLTQFYKIYRDFAGTLRLTLRQTYTAGEVMFVDYAGQRVPIHDRETGRVWQAEIFVAVLGASNYAYAEGTPDQGSESWVGSHVRAFEYFGEVPGKVVLDNLKTGVNKVCRYEPEINRAYADAIAHYGTVSIPARVRRPQDKAKVEAGVQVVQRWILAALRNQKFFSLSELNQAIQTLLIRLNERPFQKLPGSRKSVYEEMEKPALKALPERRYEYAQWKKARVNIDYHIDLAGHYYSVPYQLAQKEVLLRYTATTVEIMHNDRRVASHARDDRRGRHTTIREHMPRHHQEYLSWTPSRILETARQVGQETEALVTEIISSRDHPEQGYRSCMGIIRLARMYSRERLEQACARGRKIGARSYTSIASILKNGLDLKEIPPTAGTLNVSHENIRGSGYFNN